MERHEPIDYDHYRRVATTLRNAAISAWIEAGIGWVASQVSGLKGRALAPSAPAAVGPQRLGRTGLVA